MRYVRLTKGKRKKFMGEYTKIKNTFENMCSCYRKITHIAHAHIVSESEIYC